MKNPKYKTPRSGKISAESKRPVAKFPLVDIKSTVQHSVKDDIAIVESKVINPAEIKPENEIAVLPENNITEISKPILVTRKLTILQKIQVWAQCLFGPG